MKMKLQSTTVQSTAMLFLLAMMTSLLAAEPVKMKEKKRPRFGLSQKTARLELSRLVITMHPGA